MKWRVIMFYLVALIAVLCAALIIRAIERRISSPEEQEPTEWLPKKHEAAEYTYLGKADMSEPYDKAVTDTKCAPSSKGLTITADTSKAQRALNALNKAVGSRNGNIVKFAFKKNPNIRDCGELFHEMDIINKDRQRLKEIIEGTKTPTNQETK